MSDDAAFHEYGTRPTYPHPTEDVMTHTDVTARFQRLGATEREADALANDNPESWVVSVSNSDLKVKLDEYRLTGNIDLEGLTVAKVSEWVGDDPERAAMVAKAESARAHARKSLVAAAEKVVEDGDKPDDPEVPPAE